MLLQGKGHRLVRAKEAGLAKADDSDLAEYALAKRLVVVTFDADFKRLAFDRGCRVLYVRHPERTARERIAAQHSEISALLVRRRSCLVTVLRRTGLSATEAPFGSPAANSRR